MLGGHLNPIPPLEQSPSWRPVRSFVPPVVGETKKLHPRLITPRLIVREFSGKYSTEDWLPPMRKKLRTKFMCRYPLAHVNGSDQDTGVKPADVLDIKSTKKLLNKREYLKNDLKLPIQTDYMFPVRSYNNVPLERGIYWINV